jgi:hypothetical protein
MKHFQLESEHLAPFEQCAPELRPMPKGEHIICAPNGCFTHALGDLDQARELPYRPAAAQRRIRGRTDGNIRLRATTILKFSLARKGASTDGKPSLVQAA